VAPFVANGTDVYVTSGTASFVGLFSLVFSSIPKEALLNNIYGVEERSYHIGALGWAKS
jgi:hypothetical protein